MSKKETLMVAGKARWLLEGGVEKLSDEERRLLLALVSLDMDTGHSVTAEERQALDQIIEKTGTEGKEITRAVKHMVEAESKKESRLDWSALKKRLKRK